MALTCSRRRPPLPGASAVVGAGRNGNLVTTASSEQQKRTNTACFDSDICKFIFAVIFPPLGVFLEVGCGIDLLINVGLTILGYIPGIAHALYIIITK
ncbi:Plasma membrane proteolipid 3 [Tolypocladium ophioglossoides CBS 100239]|uniref:Plasma membrane proteolipid 3 n=1 Tax=Tolypocladium ophioglossoides (strain CBS 100239) TaxID=1163406 RepID=A0A0L0MX48_TOLOC|nr:Plasma membrane proteolipid 3 [Tolypocladium ophioglossoides CBS 100239]